MKELDQLTAGERMLFFQILISSGAVWTMGLEYGKEAKRFIDIGWCFLPPVKRKF